MVKIAPSILSADFMRLGEEIKAAEKTGADMFHIDIMDGCFVPNITIGPSVVSAIKKIAAVPLGVHLMIEKPERYINDFVSAGADYLSVHVEASVHLQRTIQSIKDKKVKAGAALNPSTPISSLECVINDLDFVLIMSVNPGFGGQSFIPQIMSKIRAMKDMIVKNSSSALIEIDGGIKAENAKEVAKAGADILVMGSAFFGSGDYIAYMKKVQNLLGQ